MQKYVILFFLLLFATPSLFAHIHGTVLSDEGEPLIGANVYWLGTSKGTITDISGTFEIEPERGHVDLVVSYLGYQTDTIHVTSAKQELTIVLVADGVTLDEFTITERKMAVIRSRTSAFDTHTLGADELCKAACCNLSESFETNASVDVAYADAATGAKQIRLLGLSGTYVQLLSENTPGVRGLAQNFGMEYIPGPWMESIQVSKGTSSVVNGYEATTGQINVEYLKPQTQDPIAVNLMLNSELHAELNIEGGWEIPLPDHDEEDEHHHHPKLHTGILAHYQNGSYGMDDNMDGFLDMPKNQQANLLNRWYYTGNDYTFQFLVRGLYDQRQGGQRYAKHSPLYTDKQWNSKGATSPYLIDLSTYRIDGFMKNGYVFDHETGASIGIITAASYHNQTNQYGKRLWKASQTNAYLNAMYQTNFEGSFAHGIDNDHKLTVGLSLNYDNYREYLITNDSMNLDRWEVTPGLFAEYTLRIDEELSLVAGVRADYSTTYGFFCTPRLNVRYTPWEWWTLRGSIGLGYRSPNIIADNAYMLPSNRSIDISNMQWVKTGVITNLAAIMEESPAQERAMNAGLSTTFYIPMGSKELQLSGEYYYTNFMDGVIADMDASKSQVVFYNLADVKGRSFSHNAQVEATMEILRGWTMTAAFRYTNVRQTTYHYGVLTLRDKPLTNKYKGVITTSYQTPLKKWQFDLTAQFNGGGRMPDGFNQYFLSNATTAAQYTEKGSDLYYKWYPQLMGQITKYFRTCSIYLGAENMTNFMEKNPLVGERISGTEAVNPWASDFDASMAWGPITGWKIYAGFRWSIDKED